MKGKRKSSTSLQFTSADEMDDYLENTDLAEVFKKFGNVKVPEVKKINLDLPKWLIGQLDLEAARAGVSRQPLIKLWLIQKLDEERKKRVG